MQEVLLIALVVLLFFGGRKIPELMKGIGKGVRSFKEGIKRVDFHPVQRIAYAKVTLYPYVFAGVGGQCRGGVSCRR